MSGNREGLCSTCKYSLKCTLTRDTSQEIHFCEEYATDDLPRKNGKARRKARVKDPDQTADHQGPVLGLCSNCIHRKTCRFPRPESGVWHCEEYA